MYSRTYIPFNIFHDMKKANFCESILREVIYFTVLTVRLVIDVGSEDYSLWALKYLDFDGYNHMPGFM